MQVLIQTANSECMGSLVRSFDCNRALIYCHLVPLLNRYTVGKITPEPKHDIGPNDFGPRASIHMNFPKCGTPLTPLHNSSDFKWKDYCPMVFR